VSRAGDTSAWTSHRRLPHYGEVVRAAESSEGAGRRTVAGEQEGFEKGEHQLFWVEFSKAPISAEHVSVSLSVK